MLKLPENLRGGFAKPHGVLYEGKGLDTILKIEELKKGKIQQGLCCRNLKAV